MASEFEVTRGMRKLWPIVAFALVTMATLRAVHHLHHEPWSPQILDAGFSQASLTVVWSLLGVGAWILGSRRANRQVWLGRRRADGDRAAEADYGGSRLHGQHARHRFLHGGRPAAGGRGLDRAATAAAGETGGKA
jgi:hypothetical protein